MTKKTKKADKPSKAGAVELTEERLDAASGGNDLYLKIGGLRRVPPP